MRALRVTLLVALPCAAMAAEKIKFALQASKYPYARFWGYEVTHPDGQLAVVSINVPVDQPHRNLQRLDVNIDHSGGCTHRVTSIRDVVGSMRFEFPTRPGNILSVKFENHFTEKSYIDWFVYQVKLRMFGISLQANPDMPSTIVELEVDVGPQPSNREDYDCGEDDDAEMCPSLCEMQDPQMRILHRHDDGRPCPYDFAIPPFPDDVVENSIEKEQL
ncbi:hypothetical protein BKA62DRAFT_87381 [Auriculariales sp. MPI-PUGE-AT-0066]|nr:hypothetical protein BKA62DRAFT_87381 [Auriculariales sp. MPI-PUGE-AT-0066]